MPAGASIASLESTLVQDIAKGCRDIPISAQYNEHPQRLNSMMVVKAALEAVPFISSVHD